MSSTATQRTLILVRLVHSPEDMGSLGHRLPAAGAYRRLAHGWWAATDRQVRALGLDWTNTRVYQDGLPDAGPEVIRKILAEVKSPNYDLLRWLVSRGADLIGTESPVLLKAEYDRLHAIVSAKDETTRASARKAYADVADALLSERDAYIARRIAATLPPAGVGLLFIGQAHRVPEHLLTDIGVRGLPVVPATGRTTWTPAGESSK